MAKNNDARKAQWENELNELRQMRQARQKGVEYVPAASQPTTTEPQVREQEYRQPVFTREASRVEISIEQLTAETNGRVYKPETIAYERVSTRTRERSSLDMGNRS